MSDDMTKPRIVSAALRLEDGLIIASPRHLDSTCRAVLNALGVLRRSAPDMQGFVDQFGKFYSREEAWVVAVANNQIIRRCGGDEGCLYSENLY